MGFSVFPQPSSGGNSNLTTTDLTTYSASIPKLTKQSTYNTSANGLSVPAGTNFVYALAIGGGGGGQGVGAGTNSNTYAKGGFAGAVSFGLTKPSTFVTVGAGGNGGSPAGNNEGKTGNSGGTSSYGSVYAEGGAAGYSLYYGNSNTTHQIGYSGILSGQAINPAKNINASPINSVGSTQDYYSYQNSGSTNLADLYTYVANGAQGALPYTSNYNTATNVAVGLPTNLGPYSGGARGGGAQVSGNEYAPWRGGGGAGYLGAGGAASANAGGNGGAGGGGGGGCGAGLNYDRVNGYGVNTTYASGGNGGAGVVELYY